MTHALYRQYINLRPKNMECRALFIAYRNVNCHAHYVGCHTISDASRRIAVFLNLENLEKYTGHRLKSSA